MSFEDIPDDYIGVSDDSATEEYLHYYAMEQGHDPYDYPEEEINEDNQDFKDWVRKQVENKYFDVEYALHDVINLNNTVDIYRAMTVSENWLEHLVQQGKHLGIYWSYDPNAAEAHWARADNSHEVLIHGKVPETSVDWESTFMLNMDIALGEDEKEIRLYDGVPVTILEISIEGEEQDISALEGKTFYA